mgnify:CR=1 FL=1
MQIFCLGSDNPGDIRAHQIGKELKVPGMKFIIIRDLDQFMQETDGLDHIVIMDVVKGIKGVELIEDYDRIRSNGICSMHDFDIGFYLKLQKELGRKITVIGLGDNAEEDEVRRIASGLKSEPL